MCQKNYGKISFGIKFSELDSFFTFEFILKNGFLGIDPEYIDVDVQKIFLGFDVLCNFFSFLTLSSLHLQSVYSEIQLQSKRNKKSVGNEIGLFAVRVRIRTGARRTGHCYTFKRITTYW